MDDDGSDGPNESTESAFDLPADELIDLFQTGEIVVEARMADSSNATLLVTVTDTADRTHPAIYKPGRGERPLWDFPGDLFRREVAMFRLSDALGWDVVPPTALADGPFGEGSIQAFVDADFDQHYFTLRESGIGRSDLERLCTLDVIANNTDRKSGHCLLGRDGRVYGIDHGLSFHAQFKLRTVLWDYVGDPLPEPIRTALAEFVETGPPDELTSLLDPFETDAMMTRTTALLEIGQFPADDTGGHRWPWPLV